MAKHRAIYDYRDTLHALKLEMFYWRNQWHSFLKPSLKRWLAGKENAFRKYYRS